MVQIFQPLMPPLLSPSTVPKHPIRHLHERAQQDGKLLKFVCSVSNPRSEGVSPMEEAEQKRKNGQIPAGITPEQAAEDARQVCTYMCTYMLPMHELQRGSQNRLWKACFAMGHEHLHAKLVRCEHAGSNRQCAACT